MPYLTIEKRANIFSTYGGKATNTGSIEGQIALLTERINSHFRTPENQQKRFFFSKRFDEDGRSAQAFINLLKQTRPYWLQSFN